MNGYGEESMKENKKKLVSAIERAVALYKMSWLTTKEFENFVEKEFERYECSLLEYLFEVIEEE